MPVRKLKSSSSLSEPDFYRIISSSTYWHRCRLRSHRSFLHGHPEDPSRENLVLPILLIATAFLIWGISLFKKGAFLAKVPQLIAHTFQYSHAYSGRTYEITIALQIPPQPKPPKKQKTIPTSAGLTQPSTASRMTSLRQSTSSLNAWGYEADAQMMGTQLPQTITSYTRNGYRTFHCIYPGLSRDSIVKYDCAQVRFVLPPPPPRPDDIMPIGEPD